MGQDISWAEYPPPLDDYRAVDWVYGDPQATWFVAVLTTDAAWQDLFVRRGGRGGDMLLFYPFPDEPCLWETARALRDSAPLRYADAHRVRLLLTAGEGLAWRFRPVMP